MKQFNVIPNTYYITTYYNTHYQTIETSSFHTTPKTALPMFCTTYDLRIF